MPGEGGEHRSDRVEGRPEGVAGRGAVEGGDKQGRIG